MNRGQYTLELGEIHESCYGKVFNFDYDFYDDQFRCQFEQKFIDYYFFNEIGFETIGRFQRNLMAHLNLNMPKWTQLYETELAAQDLDFLLNKDLRETFIRTLDTTGTLTENKIDATTNSGSVNRTDNVNTNGTTNSKVSNSVSAVNTTTVCCSIYFIFS